MSKNTRNGQVRMGLTELKKSFRKDKYFNYPNDFGQEGEDHVLISVYSKSFVGRILAPEYTCKIMYPHLGNFASVSNLWQWLREWSPTSSANDMVRNMKPKTLRAYMKNTRTLGGVVKNFKAIVGYATWLKINSRPDMIKAIKEYDETKKLLVYNSIQNSQFREMSSHAEFLIDISLKIIEAVKSDTVPDFSDYVTHDDEKCLLGYYIDDFICTVMGRERYNTMCEQIESSEYIDTEDTAYEVSHQESSDV